MHGVVAAGSVPTAEAGAEILERGGNAADAVVAACFATAVGEPSLTSLAGGGMLLYRQARSGDVTVCDFFSDVPALRPDEVPGLDFTAVDLDFGPITQRFHIGAGAAAVPGVIPGLCSMLERYGRLPLAEVIRPACRMLRQGVELGPYQGRAIRLLEPILRFTDASRRIFEQGGRLLRTGDRFALPDLADTLEALAERGWRAYYDEVLCPRMVAQFGPEAGGLLTRASLADYRVEYRQPLSVRYRDTDVLTMPPPAAGGSMIAMMLRLLSTVPMGALEIGGVEHARRLCEAMWVADRARPQGVAALEPEAFARWQARYDALAASAVLPTAAGSAGPGSTTHVSVIDAEGDAAAVTFSFGEGNGHVIAGTGIMMNNLMGEEDLHPDGFGKATPGTRLCTMMSPTILLADDGAITVMGTGGANRIRTAIVQSVSLMTDHGYDAEAAAAAPRLHYEGGVLNAEVFDMADGGDRLEALGAPRYVRFPERNLFFGGVHLVTRGADGSLRGAGDPRRGGVCRVV